MELCIYGNNMFTILVANYRIDDRNKIQLIKHVDLYTLG